MKQRCPKCGKLYSDLTRHLVLSHDVKDLSELMQKTDYLPDSTIEETRGQEDPSLVEVKQDELRDYVDGSSKNLKRVALLAIIKLRNEQREDHRLDLMRTLLTTMSKLDDEMAIMMVYDALKTAAKKTSRKMAVELIDYIDNLVGVESPRVVEIKAILVETAR